MNTLIDDEPQPQPRLSELNLRTDPARPMGWDGEWEHDMTAVLLKHHPKAETDRLVQDILARISRRAPADGMASETVQQEYGKAALELDREQHQYRGFMDVVKALLMWVETTEERVSKNRTLTLQRLDSQGPSPSEAFQLTRSELSRAARMLRGQTLVRRFASAFILISLVLAHYHSAYWLWLTAFIGFNLFQSSFRSCCPSGILLGMLGRGRGGPAGASRGNRPA